MYNVYTYRQSIYINILHTRFNPHNLRNTIKKVAKISITQINYYRTCLSKQPYFPIFLISHKFYRFRLVVDINIITKLSKTLNFCIVAINIPKLIRNQYIDKLAPFQF